MSNLGLQAIYGFLNSHEDIVCERVFWDKENIETGSLPLSVESGRPLTDFAVLAFSLNYEIDFFHIAPILKVSGIPLFSVQRDETYPLIIAGGPCITANPVPVAPFFDCLGIGEAEALLPPILSVVIQGISGKRKALLETLSGMPGLYVPGLTPLKPVVRQIVSKLNDFPVHSNVLTHDTELGDLYLVEVERGCAHNCRFCLVSSAFSPMRFRTVKSLLKQAETGLKYRKRIGLVGPAVTDHPEIELLLKRLIAIGAQISISSLRLTSLTREIMHLLVAGGMRSVALAPEAGSEGLRQSIHKGINQSQILKAIHLAGEAGITQLKLYFMVGLPGETEEDIQSIIDLTIAGKELIEKNRGKTRLALNISPFVPKAGTYFQRMPMAPLDLLQARIAFLKNNLIKQGVKINHESPHWSEVQAVLSRGDSNLAKALAEINVESLPAWRDTLKKFKIDVDFFAHQKWTEQSSLPWEMLKSTACE